VNIMRAFLVLLVSSVAAGFLPPEAGALAFARTAAPGFTAIWYREVMEGDLEGAAELYERLYSAAGLGAGSQAAAPLERARAAYRAGICFESLGSPRRARLAYAWLEKNGGEGDPLRERARLKLRRLDESEGAEPPLAPGVGEVMAEITTALKAGIAAEAERLSLLRSVHEDRLLRERSSERLLENLRRRGLELLDLAGRQQFRGATPLVVFYDGTLRSLPLEGGDLEVVRRRLADRFFERSLQAALGGDEAACRADLARSLALRPEHEGGRAFQRLLNLLRRPELLPGLAGRRLEDHRRLLAADLRRRLSGALGQADRLQRKDLAVRELENARELLETAPLSSLAVLEVRQLAERLQRAYVLAGGRQADVVWRELHLQAAHQTHELVSLCADLLASAERERRIDLSSAAQLAGLGVARSELARLKARLDELASRGGEPAELKALRKEVEILESWFPALRGRSG
jgi:hypothetical protein